jgi:Raf kinase inhibitor-like YbhB/YbcL family protein
VRIIHNSDKEIKGQNLNKKLVLLLGIVLVIVVLFVFLLFLIKRRTNNNTSNTSLEITTTNITSSINKKEVFMTIQSTVFTNEGMLPVKYSCDGEGKHPPLTFSDIPKEAQSLVLIVDDPDAPVGVFTHWVVWNIEPSVTSLSEGIIPEGVVEGITSAGIAKYIAPCPPSGTHRYYFKLFALDIKLSLPGTSERNEVEEMMKGHILASSELMGKYTRKK